MYMVCALCAWCECLVYMVCAPGVYMVCAPGVYMVCVPCSGRLRPATPVFKCSIYKLLSFIDTKCLYNDPAN